MRRTALTFLCAFLAFPLLAITGTPVRANRIGLLRIAAQYETEPENVVAATVQSDLLHELRSTGFDVVDTGMTYAELQRTEADGTPLYVEIVSGGAWDRTAGEVGIGTPGITGTVGVIVSHVAAEVRLYDGRTLELVRSFELKHSSSAIAPTGLGVGGRWSWLWVNLPFRSFAPYRSAAREVARDAAARIAEVARR